MHLAFNAKNKEDVEAFHHVALQAGGKDNGAPGSGPIITLDITPRSSLILMGTI